MFGMNPYLMPFILNLGVNTGLDSNILEILITQSLRMSNGMAFTSLMVNSQKMATDYEKYIKEDNRLRPIYEEKYKAGSVHDDIEF